MDKQPKFILTINVGSSSLKFGLYNYETLEARYIGTVEIGGTGNDAFTVKNAAGAVVFQKRGLYNNTVVAFDELLQWLEKNNLVEFIVAAGHRVVQGGPEGKHPALLTDYMLHNLGKLVYLAPNHLPAELEVINIFRDTFPEIPQIACFDNSFHLHMPDCAKYYALPEKYKNMGLQRYGFHGLSYEYIIQKLAGKTAALGRKRIIIAHLGNGASMAAIKNNIGVDTTMGMSPMGGLVMGTRPGDLDPGVSLFLLKHEQLTADELDTLFSKESGLKAIGGFSDVRKLLNIEMHNPDARAAVELFCYQAKKMIGSLAAAIGGVDILVFTGGIGANSAVIRERICKDMDFMGIEINPKSNRNGLEFISSADSRVEVKVMQTDEEWMIASHTQNLVNN
ncbi:acetate/propionate family kinase [Mucilaginibacter flavidus]|uniref:acetate/propionate family kinase n=1 Tax=Mucilaginibacter flavidus TaxID=2949309 RepID=UPI0020925C91|nr:acetate/propionate family kinase [Mucilaginibacter flavidus]MCO5946614.1 acetate/propionate family kinase [Mucilaginibacter flavidus]